jgi:arylsulfatase A-like enzyme
MTVNIENVVIFISDALRWDYLPDEIASKGVTFKTVAQGGKTAISLPTLATGLRPQQHGVSSWGQRIPDGAGIFQYDQVDASFDNGGGPSNKLVGAEEVTSLSERDSSFVHMEHDIAPHFPHGEFDSHKEYFRSRGADIDLIREDYKSSVVQSQQNFENIYEIVKKQGIIDETLFIFTSDHGEILGEHGEIEHGAPIVPELAYVPTTFIHPDLTVEDFHVDPTTEIIEHVDILPTVMSALGHDAEQMIGTDILTKERKSSFGHCYSTQTQFDIQFYEANSLWWHGGGHVFLETGRMKRLLYIFSHVYGSNRNKYLRKNLLKFFRAYWPTEQVYDQPAVNRSEAERIMYEMLDSLPEYDSMQTDLDDEAQQTLRDLGYLQ